MYAIRSYYESQFIHEFNKQTQGFISVDFESYAADHFGTLNDLLGAADFSSFADINATPKTIESLLASGFFPKTKKADQVDQSYRAEIRKAGFSLKLEHTGNRRITSYNVCYTKLLRQVKSINLNFRP